MKDRCRACRAQDGAEYRRNNKEDLAKRKAKYYQGNKERVVEYCERNKQRIARRRAQYRKDNIEMIQERERTRRSCEDVKQLASERYQDNKVEVAARAAKYREDNKERMLEREASYRKNNRNKIAGHSNKYYRNNKEKVYALGAKRRALKLIQTPKLSNSKKIQFYYTVCNETNEMLGDTFFHVDHIQPLSKGGLHCEDNLQILESRLNLQKSDMWPLTNTEQAKYTGVTL